MQTKKLILLRDVLGDYRKESKEYLFFCPRCNHHKPKLSVNLDKNCFKCWVCDYTGRKIGRLIRNHGTYLEYKVWREFDDQIQISEFDFLLNPFKEEKKEQRLDLPEEFISLVNKNLPLSSLPARQYLHNRKVTKTDICGYKIGFCGKGDYEGYVIIPSFNLNGEINYFVARSFRNHWKSYKNPNVSRNNIIFNELFLNFNEEVVIVEGVFDAIVAGHNAVPLLGSTLSEESKLFQEIVRNDTSVYVALDADAEKKSMRIIGKLLHYGIEVARIDTHGYNDVGEMNKLEFTERKRRATQVDSENFLFYEAMTV